MSVWPSLLKPQAVATNRLAPRHTAAPERGKHVGFITVRIFTHAEETVVCTTRRRAYPAHEPGANQPTPDPSQEGNWPAGVAPLLGGAGGGFTGTSAHNIRGSLSLRSGRSGERGALVVFERLRI